MKDIKKRIRVGIIYKDGTIKAYNFITPQEAEDFVLKEEERVGVKRADMVTNGDFKTRTKIW